MLKGSLLVYGLLALSIGLSVTGQLLLKLGTSRLPTFSAAHVSQFFLLAADSPWIWAGLCVYAVSATTWLAVLSRVPLSLAYPALSIGYVAVIFLSSFLFGESLSGWKVAAGCLIVAGVALLGHS